MKFTISREALLRPLQLVAGVVERRHTLPILSNILMVLEDGQLKMTGTDLEVELVGALSLEEPGESGQITVPARKLLDICKSLPDQSVIEFSTDGAKAQVKAGRSRFVLATLPADDFPNVEESEADLNFTMKAEDLKAQFDQTSFAMAQQDVRYYLNGMLLEVTQGVVRTVATDGHRLAMSDSTADVACDKKQVIVPRKGVIELQRLLGESDDLITVTIGSNHIRIGAGDYLFTSKLVEGKFPDYERVVPKGGDKTLCGSRQELRQVFQRTAILSNEKYRGVRLIAEGDSLQVIANNPEQEQAEETVSVDFEGERLEIGFNVTYLLDVLNALAGEQVKLTSSNPNSSALVEDFDGGSSVYVVMPMKL